MRDLLRTDNLPFWFVGEIVLFASILLYPPSEPYFYLSLIIPPIIFIVLLSQQKRQTKSFLEELQTKLGGELTKTGNVLSCSEWTLTVTIANSNYRIEPLNSEVTKIIVNFEAPFNLKVKYHAELQYLKIGSFSEKIFWFLERGGQKYGWFWIKTDNFGLAKTFCDNNKDKLKELSETAKMFLSNDGIVIKDGKLSFISIEETEAVTTCLGITTDLVKYQGLQSRASSPNG